MERENRGKRLSQAADRVKVEPLSFMASDGTFSKVPDIHARVSATDRFLSNFHKPLQRRMLFTKPSDPLPVSCVLRHDVTKQVYIIGQDRIDADGVSEYERLSVLHLVTNRSSGNVEVFCYHKIDDEDPNSMLLQRTSVGKFYLSLEYQSSRTERYSDNEQSTRMLFYGPCTFLDHADELCEFELNGQMWSIKQVFYDSGFSSGVVIDSGQNIEDYNIVIPKSAYDPVAGGWDFLADADLIPFSASMDHDSSDLSISSRYGANATKTLYVKGIKNAEKRFNVGMIIQAPDFSTYKVVEMKNNRHTPDLQLLLSRIVSSPPSHKLKTDDGNKVVNGG